MPTTYHDGHITEHHDGYTAAYWNISPVGNSFCLTDIGHRRVSMAEAEAAIDRANAERDRRNARFDAMTYEQARDRGIGARWPRPTFWDDLGILTVVAVRRSYIVSTQDGNLYLSMGNADCQYIGQDTPGSVDRFIECFESSAPPANVCHYCGMEAVGFDPFDAPVCRQCGGK